jgi:hypothetical protein
VAPVSPVAPVAPIIFPVIFHEIEEFAVILRITKLAKSRIYIFPLVSKILAYGKDNFAKVAGP